MGHALRRSPARRRLRRRAARVTTAIAPGKALFRAWAGPAAPEWGAALAFPATHRVVLQGRGAPSAAGSPSVALRHELAHLALHEFLRDSADDQIPRWF